MFRDPSKRIGLNLEHKTETITRSTKLLVVLDHRLYWSVNQSGITVSILQILRTGPK